MKKQRKMVISVVTCMVSICLMMFGVYAAVNPSVNLSGQVSYSATDAKILVQGKLTGAKDVQGGTYPEAATTYTNSTKVTDQNNQYLDFTIGGGVGNASDDLAPWAFGDLNFEEIDGGFTNPISVSMKITNFSAYNVKATLTMANDLQNVDRTVKKGSKILSETTDKTFTFILPANTTSAKSVEVSVNYQVADTSKSVPKQNVNFDVKFEWTNEQDTSLSVDEIIANNGIVKMGKSLVWLENYYDKDAQWKVDGDGYFLDSQGTKIQTTDGEYIKVKEFVTTGDYDWRFVTTSGAEVKLNFRYVAAVDDYEYCFVTVNGNTAVTDYFVITYEMYCPYKDIEWVAYAYKTSSGETKAIIYDKNWDDDGNAIITFNAEENAGMREAVSLYFTIKSDLPLGFYKQPYLSTDKMTKTEISTNPTNHYNCKHNGTNAPSTVDACDYYYSDICQKVRNVASELIQSLNIDSNNAVLANIKARTINELYKDNLVTSGDYSDLALSTGADGNEQDMFWLLSRNEIESYLPASTAFSYPGEFQSGSRETWTRTSSYDTYNDVYSCCTYDNYHGGGFMGQRDPDYETVLGPRIGFELAIG